MYIGRYKQAQCKYFVTVYMGLEHLQIVVSKGGTTNAPCILGDDNTLQMFLS